MTAPRAVRVPQLIFPRLAKRLPLSTLFKGSAAPCVLVYLVPPLVPAIGLAALRIPALMAQAALLQCLQSSCFTAVFMLINNSCSKAQRGRVNGLGMALSSAFKAAGPTLGAISFAWSLTNGAGFPLDVHFTFLLCGLCGACTAALACCHFTRANDAAVPEAAAPVEPARPQDESAVLDRVEAEDTGPDGRAQAAPPPGPAAGKRRSGNAAAIDKV